MHFLDENGVRTSDQYFKASILHLTAVHDLIEFPYLSSLAVACDAILENVHKHITLTMWPVTEVRVRWRVARCTMYGRDTGVQASRIV